MKTARVAVRISLRVLRAHTNTGNHRAVHLAALQENWACVSDLEEVLSAGSHPRKRLKHNNAAAALHVAAPAAVHPPVRLHAIASATKFVHD